MKREEILKELLETETLEELKSLLEEYDYEIFSEEQVDISNLPNFGGEDMFKTGVFSWDEDRILLLDDNDWVIENRW